MWGVWGVILGIGFVEITLISHFHTNYDLTSLTKLEKSSILIKVDTLLIGKYEIFVYNSNDSEKLILLKDNINKMY